MTDISCTFTLTRQQIKDWKRCELNVRVGAAWEENRQRIRVFAPSWKDLATQLRTLRSLVKSAQRGCENGIYGKQEFVCGSFILFIDLPRKMDDIRYKLRIANDLVGSNVIQFQQPWSVVWKMLAVIRDTLDDALCRVEAKVKEPS